MKSLSSSSPELSFCGQIHTHRPSHGRDQLDSSSYTLRLDIYPSTEHSNNQIAREISPNYCFVAVSLNREASQDSGSEPYFYISNMWFFISPLKISDRIKIFFYIISILQLASLKWLEFSSLVFSCLLLNEWFVHWWFGASSDNLPV